MKVINLTPHSVNIVGSMEIASSGVARCQVSTEAVGSVGAIPVYASKYGEIEGLPPQGDDTVYIVSRLVASATNRTDLFVPSGLLRDDQGRVIGCRGIERA